MDREITLGNGITFLKLGKDLTNGQSVRGTYVGIVEGKFKPAYKLQQADGSVKGINSAGKLQKLMDQVAIGSEVTIQYNGMSKIEKGEYAGTEAHDFKVTVHSADAGASSETKRALPF